MTKEEFRTSLESFFLWKQPDEEIAPIIEAASLAAEPLFEEIEKLRESEEDKIEIIKRLENLLFKAENDRTYWFDRYSLEMAKNLKLTERISLLERRPEDYPSTRE